MVHSQPRLSVCGAHTHTLNRARTLTVQGHGGEHDALLEERRHGKAPRNGRLVLRRIEAPRRCLGRTRLRWDIFVR